MPERFGPRLIFSVLALGLASLGAWVALHSSAGAAQQRPESLPATDPLEEKFSTRVRPFFERYCFGCHGPKKQKGELDLSREFSVAAIAKNARRWESVRARLEEKEMPPEDAPHQPGADERGAAIAWLRE